MKKGTHNEVAIVSLSEADVALAAIAAHKRRIALVETALNEDIAALTHKANASTRADRNAIKNQEDNLEAFALSSKDILFTEKRSQALSFGIFGFRISRRLVLLPGWTWQRVTALIKEQMLERCLRTCVELDKDGMKGLDPAELAQFGCAYERKEGFYYELDTRALSDGSRSLS